MVVDRFTSLNFFDIFQPRWRDRKVLLAKHKIGEHNKIVFSKAPSLGTAPYYISGKEARKYKTESNGKIDCLAVPISALEPLEISERSIEDYR